MLNGLDLFSGIGGLTVALAPWVLPIAYCENDRYAQSVLLSRMRDGRLPTAPIWDDVITLRALQKDTDIIYGGFPCQDISVAGNGEGLEGKRSGLFFEVARLVSEIEPSFIFLENVPAIRTRGAERIGQELSNRGYDCRWDVISAAEIGAPHLRKRWFLLAAHAERLKLRDEQRRRGWTGWGGTPKPGNDGSEEPLAHSKSKRLQGQHQSIRNNKTQTERRASEFIGGDAGSNAPTWWTIEPDVGRVANGVPQRVDRIRALGNAVVPLQARTAFKRLMGLGE